MRCLQLKLYSIAAPLALLPLMDFSFEQIPAWFKGVQFQGFVAQSLSQLLAGIADAILVVLFGLL